MVQLPCGQQFAVHYRTPPCRMWWYALERYVRLQLMGVSRCETRICIPACCHCHTYINISYCQGETWDLTTCIANMILIQALYNVVDPLLDHPHSKMRAQKLKTHREVCICFILGLTGCNITVPVIIMYISLYQYHHISQKAVIYNCNFRPFSIMRSDQENVFEININ